MIKMPTPFRERPLDVFAKIDRLEKTARDLLSRPFFLMPGLAPDGMDAKQVAYDYFAWCSETRTLLRSAFVDLAADEAFERMEMDLPVTSGPDLRPAAESRLKKGVQFLRELGRNLTEDSSRQQQSAMGGPRESPAAAIQGGSKPVTQNEPSILASATKARVFIGSSVENVALAYAVQENLQHDVYSEVWTQGVFQVSKSSLDSLQRALPKYQFAVFIFAPDDITTMRDAAHATVRDNVIFELGLFIGRLGAERCFIIAPRHVPDFHLPTDLLGMTPADYDPGHPGDNPHAMLGPAANRIRIAIQAQAVSGAT